MSQIAHTYFLDNPMLDLSIVALVLFLSVFASVSFAAFRMQRARIDALSRLPFEGDEK